MWKNLATLPSATDSVPSNGWADAVVRAARAAVAPFIDPVAEAGHRRLRNRPGPILDTHHVTLVCVNGVRVQRGLLLLLFSTDAAETLLEAAVHHPRAAAAARRVVGGAQASVFTSAAVLPVRAPVVGGRLGRVGAVRDARVGQDERKSVRAGRVWCQ